MRTHGAIEQPVLKTHTTNEAVNIEILSSKEGLNLNLFNFGSFFSSIEWHSFDEGVEGQLWYQAIIRNPPGWRRRALAWI